MSQNSGGGRPPSSNWSTSGQFSAGQSGSPPASLVQLLTGAVQMLQAGDLAGAEGPATEALKLAPNNPDCHLIMGTLRQNQGQLKDAERHYGEALRLNPDNLRALTNLGMLQLNAGRGKDAVASLEKAIAIDASALDARHFLARAYGQCERFDDAIKTFEYVMERVPGNADVLAGYANALDAAGRDEEAAEILKRVEELRLQ